VPEKPERRAKAAAQRLNIGEVCTTAVILSLIPEDLKVGYH